MKKNHYSFIFASLFLVLLAGTASAQLNVSGEFRTRGEFRDGYQSLRDDSKTPYGDILGRTRILLDYKNDHFTTRFSLQQAYVYGQNNFSSDTISKNTINVYEAWFKYNFNKNFGVKLGRIELSYDDNRFIGTSNWSMWGATHDLIMAQWQCPNGNYSGDLGIAVNNMAPAGAYLSSYNLKNNYKYMGYLYENRSFLNNKLRFSFLGLVDAFQKNPATVPNNVTATDTLSVWDQFGNIIGTTVVSHTSKSTKTIEYPEILYVRGTGVLDGWLTLKKFSAFGSFAYQGGHYRDGRKLQSYFYSAWASYQIAKPLRLLVGYDHLSGNNYSDTTELKKTVKGFSTLYGTNHQFYGYMDLFSNVVRDNLSYGLNDLYARCTVNFCENMSLETTWRWFSLPYGYLKKSASNGSLAYQSVDKNLGHEIDIMYTYKPYANLEFSAAYCFFLQTNTMDLMSNLKAGSSEFANYAYVMLVYKPNFFNSEKK
ncbi:MAG: alginate export family protein [Bacteroidota bacterium]|nr:alginate export family protein [Bacteroidota bacterium]